MKLAAYSIPKAGESSSMLFPLSSRFAVARVPRQRLSVVVPSAQVPAISLKSQRNRLQNLHFRIKLVVAGNAALASTLTLVVYFCTYRRGEWTLWNFALETVAAAIAVAQVALVVVHWEQSLRYWELMRGAVDRQTNAIPPLGSSKTNVAGCALECALHILIPLSEQSTESRFTLFGYSVNLSIEDFLFILVTLRNYHTLRLIYWFSHLSGLRFHFYASISAVKSRLQFALRCYLAEYAVPLILEVLLLMVVVAGFADYALEHSTCDSSWDHFWEVANTQLTIGYGDIVPKSPFSQVSIVFSCFFGTFLFGLVTTFSEHSFRLSPKENDMYFHLTKHHKQRRYKEVAALLIQRWWKVMKARVRKKPSGALIIQLFSQLTLFRIVLLRAHDPQYLRLSKQAEIVGKSVDRRLQEVSRFFRPVTYSHALVSPTQSQHFLDQQHALYRSAAVLQLSVAHILNLRLLASNDAKEYRMKRKKKDGSRLSLPTDKSLSNIRMAMKRKSAYLSAMCYSVKNTLSSAGSSSRDSTIAKAKMTSEGD